MKIGKFVSKHSKMIIIISTILLVPAVLGFMASDINYDILSYLPQDIGSTKGQDILDKKFNSAATSMLILEDKTEFEVDEIKEKIAEVKGVNDVISRSSLVPNMVPNEFLPKDLENAFYSENSTLVFVKFDYSAASIETQEAVQSIREIVGDDGYLSGISPTVKDTKDLTDKETPVYTGIAVVLSLIVLSFLTKSTFIPIFFLVNIGYAVLYNMGTNFVFGNISYLTKSIAAVLQLAVTMDYSIFLYHRYEEERRRYSDHREAMAIAIEKTINALSGSSLTTIAGFLALIVMRLTLGKDIGLVMVKGVIFGLLTCVTVLPSFILTFDKLIHKYQHKVLLPQFNKTAKFIAKHHVAFLILAIVLLIPSVYGSLNYDVYYNLDRSLPRDLQSVVALNKLKDDYDMQSTHFIVMSDKVSDQEVKKMSEKIKDVDGINSVLSKSQIKGAMIPDEILPDKLIDNFERNGYQMVMIQSKYKVASDEVHNQINQLKNIVVNYDKNAYITGEAELTDDLTTIADKDFKNVNILSISVVFVIIAITLKSISLPILLILAIELAIQMNMAVPFYVNQTIPFVASIIIGTIQLGSTIDYSILMTTRWMEEIRNGADRLTAIETTIRETSSSIITSALSFIVATAGVGLYSQMEIVSVFGHMMARGAFFSMLVILFILPSIIYFATPLIIKTTSGLSKKPESVNQ
ncbi:MMPL family transporter [Helcococcus kunzii]|uniref:efflux RND transporter permease subunit n=1 Tax=Helcococcus kunzii TaxID=40091 RepID=UPI001C9609D4|nr:MMPL family transporter [Helcococcus kunzii]QZO75999.1 MMPL family transporter [Helcococcus kunzii]